jgi:hypothetical protein
LAGILCGNAPTFGKALYQTPTQSVHAAVGLELVIGLRTVIIDFFFVKVINIPICVLVIAVGIVGSELVPQIQTGG